MEPRPASPPQRRPRDPERGAAGLTGPREPLIPDPEDPGFLGEQFLRIVYRTTRALLACKGLLQPGQSIHEATIEQSQDVLRVWNVVHGSSVLAALAPQGSLPTVPVQEMTEEEIARLAACHMAAADQLGLADLPACRWLQNDTFLELFPTAEAILEFEDRVVERAGKRLLRRGRLAAGAWLAKVLGRPSLAERKDWSVLPMSAVRASSQSFGTEDDRLLMVARLERMLQQAQGSLDLRLELAAMRELAKVQGLTFLDDTANQRALLQLYAARKGDEHARIPDIRALPGPPAEAPEARGA